MTSEASLHASPAFARAQVSTRARPGRDPVPGDIEDDAPGLRARWIQGQLTRSFMRQSRERQPLGLLLMLTMAALCWGSGSHLAVSAWLAVGLLIAAMRRRVVALHARDHQGDGADSLHLFLARAAPVFILEAPFWGVSVLLFFARIPEANQLGCWLVLTLVVYGPITRLALVPFLLYWSMNGFFVVMLACVLYGVFLGPMQGSLNYWFVGLTLLHWAVILGLGRAIHANQEEHFGLQYDLALRERQATEAVSTKNRFLAAATHDLRQPVSALALYADFLKENPETHAELAPKIAKATAAVSHLFDSLFDLSVLDSGKVQLSVEPVQIADVVRDLQLQYEPLAEAKNIRLRVRTGQATIQSDPVRLRRMVGNVLSNAIKYSSPGKKILLAARLQQGDVVVEVFDQGIGIPADQIEKVFEEFYRVNDAATPAADGVGLGLSLVARLAKALKSEVRLDSVAGRGTRCSMRLGNLPGGDPANGPGG
ncbi:HAMP domain-containing sensor histidine kinase [Variovorax sp. J22P271]|uniref:sensor histidine kinase n=1 Tax=Variovorax davisae TaxID=3053515 RepID=UPI0025787A3B|nr:HAMP domain-containing sensor histidine kinase [Variovorax sp. J22P271]MDM0031321.1 HAMP domain-containing sensor histidine kinase [Variovorax sp. J22P271]